MHLTALLLPNGGKKSPLINLCRLSTPEHLILNHLFRGIKAIENAASWMKWSEVNWLSRVRLFVTPWTVACTKSLRPWEFLGKSTRVGCRFLLQGIFPTQGSNPGLPHCRQTLYCLSHQGSPAEMKEAPIHNWNSKCSLCSDLRFYQVHGDACVVCGHMSSLQLGGRVWKWSQLLANLLTQILSLVGLRGTKNVK